MLVRALALVLTILAGATSAQASSTFWNLPAATLPLSGAPTAVPMDQGAGCPYNAQPCATVQAPAAAFSTPPTNIAINTTGAACVPVTVTANVPLNGVYISCGGSNVVWCPIFGSGDPLSHFGCPSGAAVGASSFTAQFASVLTTSGSATQQESAVFSLVYNQTGQRSNWAASTGYSPGQYVANAGNLYLESGSSPCTSAGSGGPTGLGSSIADNTCLWNYAAPQYAAGKQSANFNILSLAGGGQSWGLTAGNTVEAGWNSDFATGAEIEVQNFSNIDAFQGSGTSMFDLYIGGQIGVHPITSELYLSKGPNASNPSGFGSYAGISITGPNTIENEDVYLSNTGAIAGYYQTGTFGIATYDDVSIAPFALLLNGTYGSAAIRVAPGVNEPWSSQGLFFDGTGHVNATGFISATPITTGTPATYACWTSAGVLVSSVSAC